MNFLADESCAWPVIQALREAGHDVVAIAEIAPGSSDDQVLKRALDEKRVLITEDRDFGELVYAHRRSSAGVILVRFPSRARSAKAASVVDAVAIRSPTQKRFCCRRTRTSAYQQQAIIPLISSRDLFSTPP